MEYLQDHAWKANSKTRTNPRVPNAKTLGIPEISRTCVGVPAYLGSSAG